MYKQALISILTAFKTQLQANLSFIENNYFIKFELEYIDKQGFKVIKQATINTRNKSILEYVYRDLKTNFDKAQKGQLKIKFE